MTPSEHSAAFLAALRDTGRGGCDRWVLARGVDRDDAEAVHAAKGEWQRLRLLDDPGLHQLALSALSGATGRPVTESDSFPSMLWPGGATDTYGGKRFKGTVGDFVERVLRARALVTAPKRSGWVVTPTSNKDGHRTNASTTAVHALNFDCDGRGEWFELLATFQQLGLAYIAYQSGGWTPATPKWHVLVFLDEPSDTSDPAKIDAHKRSYNAVRVLLGAIARLPGEGFDPTVETPAVPIFITERRSESDPPRQVLWCPGLALDLPALLAALPEVPVADLTGRAGGEVEEGEVLADERLEQIVAALCEPMSKILSGRRDLYLCLAGTLLDRGLTGDDMISIVEQVSIRCPGDPEYTHAEVETKHKQHVHDAETTAAKRATGGEYTRVGTLVERWPDVMRAIDAVLPNEEWQGHVEWLDELGARTATGVAPSAGPAPPRPAIKLSALRAEVRRVRDRRLKEVEFDRRVRGYILDDALQGRDLVPRRGGRPVKRADGSTWDRASAIEAAVWAIALGASAASLSFDALSVFLRPSLVAMVEEGEEINHLVRLVESTFKRAVELRHENEKKREAEENTRRQRLTTRYFGKGL